VTPSLRIDIAEAILWFHIVVIAFSVFGLVAIPMGAWGGWRGVRVFWWRALHVCILAIVGVIRQPDRVGLDGYAALTL
jgi:hypothetical protein